MSGKRTPWLYVAAGLAILAGIGGLIAARSSSGARGYTPASDAPRLAGASVPVPEVLEVSGFDWLDGELYLLDARAGAIIALRRDSAGDWHVVRRFGRRGAGPGELTRPTDIARLRDPAGIGVVDQGRLHLFDTAGAYFRSLAMDLPCPVALPRLAAGARGVFVHGDCMRRSPAADTVHAVLFWSADGEAYTEIARDARFATDGGFGTIFGARTAFTAGITHHLFGSGISNCIDRIAEGTSVSATRTCDLQDRAFPLRLRAGTRRALAARARNGAAARLPRHFAWYEERYAGSSDLVLRPFDEDSLVLRRIDGAEDLAVLPHAHLAGCRPGGCLYTEPVETGMRLRLLAGAALEAVATPLAHRTRAP